MAYGGGTWLVQNKVLPGTYINFQSLSRAELIFSDRGYAAIGLELDWGVDGEIFTVENGDFIENSTKFFGYSYDNEKLKGLRDFYKHAQTGYIYKLNSGGTKASNTMATAKYRGIKGNDITVAIAAPSIPSLGQPHQPKIIIGSSIMFTTAPTICATVVCIVYPVACNSFSKIMYILTPSEL